MIAAVNTNGLTSAALGPSVAKRGHAVETTAPIAHTVVGTTLNHPSDPEPADTVYIAGGASRVEQVDSLPGSAELPERTSTAKPPTDPKQPGQSELKLPGEKDLTPKEQQRVEELEERDREIRRHERAHKAAAGPYVTSGPTYEYETGPDGRQYAIEGEVYINTSPARGDPQATVRKMQQVRRAALAPGNPSAQDRAVASQAASAEQQARAQQAEQSQLQQAKRMGNDQPVAPLGNSPAGADIPVQTASSPSPTPPPLATTGEAADRPAQRVRSIVSTDSPTPGNTAQSPGPSRDATVRELASRPTNPGRDPVPTAQPNAFNRSFSTPALGTRLDVAV